MTLAWTAEERIQSIDSIKSSNSLFDITIVGGGITGCGIARDAALRGLKVLLVEKDDFASGTSSRSSKLLHGGLRYLEYFEFALVHESVRERALQWKLASPYTEHLPFIFPCYKDSRVPLWKIQIGLKIYDFLAAYNVPEKHRRLSKKECAEELPALVQDELKGAVFYYDGSTDDARLTLANAYGAHKNGAQTLNRVEFCGIEWNPKNSEKRNEAHAVKLKDTLTGEEFNCRTKVLVSAGGPWTDSILEKASKKQKNPICKTSRGSHIVVSKKLLNIDHAITLFHPTDKRVLFAIPWQDFTVIGTTDVFDEKPPEEVCVSQEEVEYLLKVTQEFFPKSNLKKSDIVSTWSGLRPLVSPPEGAGASAVSRDHKLHFYEEGLAYIAGGKLTTYRQMAEDCVDLIINETHKWKAPLRSHHKDCSTKSAYLPVLNPSPYYSSDAPIGISEAAQMSIENLLDIIKNQRVFSIEDLFVRRTHIFYKEEKNGLDILNKYEKEIKECLEANGVSFEDSLKEYESYLEKNMKIPLGR